MYRNVFNYILMKVQYKRLKKVLANVNKEEKKKEKIVLLEGFEPLP